MFNEVSYSLNLTFLIVTVAFNSFLAIFVFHSNLRSATNRLYALLSINISAWLIINFLSVDPSFSHVVLTMIRLTIFLAAPMSMLFFLLARTLPGESLGISKRNLFVAVFFTAVTMVLAVSPYAFTGIQMINGTVNPIAGPGLLPFAILSTVFSVSAVFTLVRKFRKSSGVEKEQFRFVMFGVLTMLGLIILTIFIPVTVFKVNTFAGFTPFYTLIFLALTAYAIVKLQLFNLKVIATEAFTAIIWIALFAEILMSQTLAQKIIAGCVFAATVGFGMLLIRSVRNEVTAREQLQVLSKELEKANKQLKEVDQAKSEFLSVASHQLRTPLTAIKGYASMLLEGDFGNIIEPQKKNIKIIYDSAQRLADLVADLLDLSRIESGRMEFDFGPVNFCDVVESVMQELVPKAKARNLLLYFDNVNRTCPEVRADKEKIRQVVINLIDNALKYTVQGSVMIQLLRVGDRLQLSIKDTGIGIDPAEKDKLFEKFFRTKAANELTREGTGLGIYVVRKIVNSHGGNIWFESGGVNQGTTFYVTLPVPRGEIKVERVKIDSMEAF